MTPDLRLLEAEFNGSCKTLTFLSSAFEQLSPMCFLSLSQAFFKQYRIKKIWLTPGIEPRTTCLMHKHSATELRQPASEQTLQFCIYTVKGY